MLACRDKGAADAARREVELGNVAAEDVAVMMLADSSLPSASLFED